MKNKRIKQPDPKIRYTLLFIILLLWSCEEPCKENCLRPNKQLSYTKIGPRMSNIWFENEIQESENFNYYTFPYMYGGAGVAVGDVNNDGLPDIYFAGNMVKNRLYINQGNFKFADITSRARVGADETSRWITGVSMADVNDDGWLDIYVCASGPIGNRKNLLYINNGDYTFTEQADKFGLADTGFSTQSTFFDYDRDGDLDVYICAYPPSYFQNSNQFYLDKQSKNEEYETDRLYRNENNTHFVDVTEQAGIRNFGLSLNATVSDFNHDDWPDIYVSNDFNARDFYYVNNGDGTFSERLTESFAHTSNFGMGSDAADVNNDGLIDLFQLDMLSDSNEGRKRNMSSMSPEQFYDAVDKGLHYQYMKNTLQLNNGNNTFSDISELAGVAKTNWSWSTLLSDLNNDGWKDIFVTNGIRRNVNDNDFSRLEQIMFHEGTVNEQNRHLLLTRMPIEPTDNYVFVNNGDLTFTKLKNNGGLSLKGFSHGAAYADLDNDGDLDMVVNNMESLSSIYKNNIRDSLPEETHFLKIRLQGTRDNKFAIGAKVLVVAGQKKQFQELIMTRGYQSSVGSEIHFGLGKNTKVDSIMVKWPNGYEQVVTHIKADRLLKIKQDSTPRPKSVKAWKTINFIDITNRTKLNVGHEENEFDDFSREVLLPHRMSRLGPALAVSDVNGDGLDDVFIGGALGFSAALYLQDSKGHFQVSPQDIWKSDELGEDISALFFDADMDGDNDLYVVSGGNEHELESEHYQDRLYINEGKGQFKKDKDALPHFRLSGSCIKSADYDGDGDMDLFVGGRQIPGQYPNPATSILLRNDGFPERPLFTDVTTVIAPVLEDVGMVTDAIWTDVNGDKRPDLVIVGEWMPIKVLINEGNVFLDRTDAWGTSDQTGWWNTVVSDDFDKDGDMDLVAGNLGLNYKYKASEEEPFELYAGDFDKNGKQDIALGYYEDGVLYPLRGRECSSQQIPSLKNRFPTYGSFAQASFEKVYGFAKDGEVAHYLARNFATTYFENTGNGFMPHPLGNLAQVSSTNTILADDYDKDGHKDLVLAGNLYQSEVETPRNDAGYGLLLTGDGNGNFTSKPAMQTGLSVRGEVRESAWINLANGSRGILFARNNDKLKLVALVNSIEDNW